jgi:hypothetical protein
VQVWTSSQHVMAGAIAPSSALSCLDEIAGEAVEGACEKAVFASPEAVAAGVKYVTAQLRFPVFEIDSAGQHHGAGRAATARDPVAEPQRCSK